MTTDDGVSPATSLALQRGALQTEEGLVEAVGQAIALVATPSGALFVGPADGENGVDGLVVRVVAGEMQAVATTVTAERRPPRLEAVTLLASSEPERWRDALGQDAYWHAMPGELHGEVPVVEPIHGPIVLADAGLRDRCRQGEFDWSRWVDEALLPAGLEALERGEFAARVPFPGRSEEVVVLTSDAFPGGAALFAGFDSELRVAALHLAPIAVRDEQSSIELVREARSALRAGDPSRAAERAMSAISILESERDLRGAGRVGFVLAEAHSRAHAPSSARRALEEALVRLEVARDADGQRVARAHLDLFAGRVPEEHAS